MRFALFLLVTLLLGSAAAITTAQSDSILTLAAERDDLTTLVALIEAAELTDALAAAGPLTLFAPNNAAFEQLPPAVVAYLQAPAQRALLTQVLTHHVLPSAVMAADLAPGVLPTLAEDDVMVQGAGASLTIDGVQVIEADLAAGNGVVHVVGAVLLPAFDLPLIDPFDLSGDISAAGSSTVFPVTDRMKELFSEEGFSGEIINESIGTGAGFERFCVAVETDISNASRAIRAEESALCEGNGRQPLEFRVGTDALAVVVSEENDFLQDVTQAELVLIFGGAATTWDQVRPEYPNEPIALYSPGTDSGTFDYFVEEIFDGDEGLLLAATPQLSEDDEVLAVGVETNPFAIGYFGYAYYQRHADTLRPVPFEGIAPNEVTAEDGTYPLARPLYIYSDATIMAEKPQVAAFINFYLTNVSAEIVDVGYFPASARALSLAKLIWLAADEMK